MSKYTALTFISVFAIIQTGFSQANQKRAIEGAITGKICDAGTLKPIEFAYVILFNQKDNALVAGTTSGKLGRFQISKIQPGSYYLEVQFIGYQKHRLDTLEVGAAKLQVDLGKILLQQTTLSLDGVEVQGEPMPMTYQTDKKVINVSQQQTAISGTAVDVLENVPSVTVDIEGEVRLRGSSNFTVLIDGRPSVLEPSETLQQIPASTIDKIEIITNPSAKYKSEGASGIINIIPKKDQRPGNSGLANLNGGLGDKYGADLLHDHKNENLHITLGVDYNRRTSTGTDREENQTKREDLTSYVHSSGDSRRGDKSLGVRGDLELNLGRKDVGNFGVRYGDRNSRKGVDLEYAEWAEAAIDSSLYVSTTDRDRQRNFYALSWSHQHRFTPGRHELAGEVSVSRRDTDQATTYGLLTTEEAMISGKRTTEAGPLREVRTKLDYSLALGEEAKFESGYQSEFSRSEVNTGSYEYDPRLAEYVLQTQFSQQMRYDETIHAVYAIFAGDWHRLGYQAGVRGEYTDRAIESQGDTARFTINGWDYFPTFHLSRKFSNGQQAMASYTRRIHRPSGGELEPFETWTDAYNVQTGNPSLQPEYIDSYEIGYQTDIGHSVVSVEAYYRKTRNLIEWVRSVYDDNITLHSVQNLGKDKVFGGELSLDFDLSKKWDASLTGDFYNDRIAGTLFGESFERESFNWKTRLSNTVKLGASTRIQLDGIYKSPSIRTQGRREGYFTAHAAIKYELPGKMLSAVLQVKDFLRTAKNERTSEGVDFYTYSYSTKEAPVVMLNLKYNFNNYKPEHKPKQEVQEAQDDEEDF